MDRKRGTSESCKPYNADMVANQDSTDEERKSGGCGLETDGNQLTLHDPISNNNVELHGPNDQGSTLETENENYGDSWENEGQVLFVFPRRIETVSSSDPGLGADSREPYVLYRPQLNDHGYQRRPKRSSVEHSQLNDSPRDQPGQRRGKIGKLRNQKKESEIQLPVPRNLRGLCWLAESVNKLNLGTSGYSYEGEISCNQMHGLGCLYIGDEQQFLKGRWSMNHLEELQSCQFTFPRSNTTVSIVQNSNNHLLCMKEIYFSASVMLASLDDLDFTMSTNYFKKSLLDKITVQEILEDDLECQRDASLKTFTSILQNLVDESADPIVRAKVLIILENSLKTSNFTMANLVQDEPALEDLRVAAKDLLTSERRYLNNASNFFKTLHKSEPLKMYDIVSNIYRECLTKYRQVIVSKCPQALPRLASEILQMDDRMIVYIRKEDIAVFEHIVSQSCFEPMKGFFEDLVEKFVNKIHSIKTLDPSDVMPLLPTVYGFLVKTFWEINLEINETTKGYKPEDLLKCESGNWKLDDDILLHQLREEKGDSENHEYQINVAECKIIFKMMKALSPENEIVNVTNAMKSFAVLDQALSSCDDRFEFEGKTGLARRMEKMPQDRVALSSCEDGFVFEGKTGLARRIKKMPLDRVALSSCEDGSEVEGKTGLARRVKKMPQDRVALSSCEDGFEFEGKTALARRIKKMPLDRVVWLQLLDLTIHSEMKDDADYKTLLKPYTPLLEKYILDVEQLDTENHELLREVTHNVGKFITSTAPYFKDSHKKNGAHVDILVQQISLFSTAAPDPERNNSSISNSRDLITEYNRYMSLRLKINIEPGPGYFSSQISTMMQTLNRIIEKSLKKSVPNSTLVAYLRSLNDFLDDFKNIDFLAVWYVKGELHVPDIMEKIENELAERTHCSYRVTDIDRYVAQFESQKRQPPDHCIIHIVTQLLECIEECLEKKWTSEQLPEAQLESTSVMLGTVRRSLRFLNEQPNYVDFEVFKRENKDPFIRLMKECSTVDDLNKRANILNESFWYIRKMDEIGIDQALDMLKKDNTSLDFKKLLDGYNAYLRHYEHYIAEYSSIISQSGSHEEGLDAVRKMIDFRALAFERPNHYSKWTADFKTEKIPAILAALSALWSILTSRDVSGTGKFLKPHCIQILCAMRLLGVDSPKTGVMSHLAQVLTGQGKSVILALLSSTFAVTGHKVRVLCYSKYLSSRDQGDFKDLFKYSLIPDEIRYGTFEDMAKKFIYPVCNGNELSLPDMVRDKVMNHTDWSSNGTVTAGPEEVLLIDEVDVFFTKDFYGSVASWIEQIEFSGLLEVQENMWSLASSKNHSAEEMVQLSKEFITCQVAAENQSMRGLEAFMKTPGTFSLLREEDGQLIVKQYTNQSLLDEHLLIMANDALSVADCIDQPTSEDRYLLNSDGLVLYRDPITNIYSETINSYENSFQYFRLKRSNFDSENFQNYGYLLVNCGNISYARLPLQHNLILGVSGTVANLGKYEQSGLESYGMNKISIIPSFYGASNLKFNENDDFHYFSNGQDWLKKIYDRANHMVSSHRAVIIFFESDPSMAVFTKQYAGKFSRMNLITANTAANERDALIEESGLSGAVTLATREMGRGVDYKSSYSVEKNGGVHVIQTFYSTDIKEEVQIKGRTARKDYKGSFEIIIRRESLVENDIISNCDNTTHTYASLDAIRRRLSDELGKTVNERIQNSESDHNTTMKYFGLM